MNDEFLKENRVGNAYYPNEYYIEGVNERFIYDETSPRTRTFIVTDEEEFAKMFDSFPAEIDFASQMLVVYMFRVINGRPHHMRKLKVEDGKLSIRIKEENCNSDDTTMPGRKCGSLRQHSRWRKRHGQKLSERSKRDGTRRPFIWYMRTFCFESDIG